ncbi:MAG TPA: potassium transporter Kef [Polyangiaceae bacterium]
MSPIVVLVGLLLLSYAGSFLVGGRTLRGAGLPSGLEYVGLGFLLGPHLLGIVGREMTAAFEPLGQVAIGWFALVVGLDFGRAQGRRAHVGRMALGLLGSALTGGAVAAAVWFYAIRVRHAAADRELLLLAGGLGSAGAETTRHVIRWASERHGAAGKLTQFLGDVAHADDLVPLVAMAALFSLYPVNLTRVHVPLGGWVGVTIGFGVVLGAMTAMHIGRELRVDQTWGVLLGMSVLGVGVAARLALSPMTVLFFMGWTTAALSRHRAALRKMVAPVERPILLPALVLAGAHVDFRGLGPVAVLLAVAVLARVVAKLVFGAALALPFRASPALGAGLLSSGALTISVGLSFAIRFPDSTGNAVLAFAFMTCIVGEIFGPLTLRRALRDAGEIGAEGEGIPSEAPGTVTR